MDEATLFQLWLVNEVPCHLHEHHDRAFALWQERIIDALPRDIAEPFEAFKRARDGSGSWWPSLPGAGVIYPLLSLSAWAVPALSVTRTAYQGYKLYKGLSSMLW